MTYRLLDTFCKAGGCSVGYQRAGFEVVGVDIEPQKNFPFEFYQADAIEFIREHGHEFDAIHASPPCQKHSAMTRGRWQDRLDGHLDLIGPTREILIASGKLYVIENVVGAPLINPVMLCGTMFGLQTKQGNQLQRHRLFETNFEIGLTPPCNHNVYSDSGVHGGGQHPKRRKVPPIGVYGNTGGSSKRDSKSFFGIDARREAMGIDWMPNRELVQAIPPAYTEFIGKQLMRVLKASDT